MKHKKKKLNIKKITLFILLPLIFITFIVLVDLNLFKSTLESVDNHISNFMTTDLDYDIIKIDENPNYLGIGQKAAYDKNGYFTTFTTIDENKKIYIEYKQNGKSSWSQNPYWENNMETDGCGITAMSIILSGYNKNYTPEDLRKKYYPLLNADNISYELSSYFDIKNSGFYYDNIHLSNDSLIKHLESNRPIIVCVWSNLGENRWTTASHYMVLLAYDGNGLVYVSNPNGLENSSKSSGWYDINEITSCLAKAMYIEEY